jgi:hypothetical protein
MTVPTTKQILDFSHQQATDYLKSHPIGIQPSSDEAFRFELAAARYFQTADPKDPEDSVYTPELNKELGNLKIAIDDSMRDMDSRQFYDSRHRPVSSFASLLHDKWAADKELFEAIESHKGEPKVLEEGIRQFVRQHSDTPGW